MLLKLTLAPNREDRPRYAVLVSYETAPMEDYGARLRAVERTWEWVQDPNGKWRWLNTRTRVLRRVPGLRGREWPRKLEPWVQPEVQRRRDVMALRALVHVDPERAAREPDWDAALQLRLDAEARSRAEGKAADASHSPYPHGAARQTAAQGAAG